MKRPGLWEAQPYAPDLLGHDVERVEERVDPVREELAHEGRLVDSVHLHEQLVERHPAAASEHAAWEHRAEHPVELGVGRRKRTRCRLMAGGEETLAPGAGLEHDVARGIEGAHRPEEEVVVDRARGVRLS